MVSGGTQNYLTMIKAGYTGALGRHASATLDVTWSKRLGL